MKAAVSQVALGPVNDRRFPRSCGVSIVFINDYLALSYVHKFPKVLSSDCIGHDALLVVVIAAYKIHRLCTKYPKSKKEV